jgi:hypothetical protein
MNDELARCASTGVLWSVLSGVTIGIPPILHFGTDEQRERIVRPVLSGDKRVRSPLEFCFVFFPVYFFFLSGTADFLGSMKKESVSFV